MKTGRPTKKIDKRMFEKLCEIQCTQEEICSVLDCDDKTLTRWCKDTYDKSFSEIFKSKRTGGRTSLRRMQWKTAEKGNVSMQIWLGKQFLEQSDKQELKHNGTIKLEDFLDGKI